jgi:hypothetical protein
MNRFVVIAKAPPAPVKNRISEKLRELEVGWWHWYQDAWLIVDREDRPSTWWRDRLREWGLRQFIVFQVPAGARWSAFGKKEYSEWLHRNWKMGD